MSDNSNRPPPAPYYTVSFSLAQDFEDEFLGGPDDKIVRRYANGCVHYYLHKVRHRDDGPAVVNVHGSKQWFSKGFRHRDDGPAVVRLNGRHSWYLHGVRYQLDEYAAKMNWTDEEIIEYKLMNNI